MTEVPFGAKPYCNDRWKNRQHKWVTWWTWAPNIHVAFRYCIAAQKIHKKSSNVLDPSMQRLVNIFRDSHRHTSSVESRNIFKTKTSCEATKWSRTLWVSQLMLATPLTRKSLIGMSWKPACSMKGSRKPPRQASTWTGMPCLRPSCAMSAMGSAMPWGKLGTEPTSCNRGHAMKEANTHQTTIAAAPYHASIFADGASHSLHVHLAGPFVDGHVTQAHSKVLRRLRSTMVKTQFTTMGHLGHLDKITLLKAACAVAGATLKQMAMDKSRNTLALNQPALERTSLESECPCPWPCPDNFCTPSGCSPYLPKLSKHAKRTQWKHDAIVKLPWSRTAKGCRFPVASKTKWNGKTSKTIIEMKYYGKHGPLFVCFPLPRATPNLPRQVLQKGNQLIRL